ncbi:GspE/PulE family protein [Spartinivicinus poritis]|uniref:ATPase, T2SS/T4P/T4SS family n=1 Tax=Spartinivicinus poritis TaxID=2994640 RepID=A0ABT5UHF9_9GAMM|nr:type II/IV secretion system protein [Spartinivicinus sp. A2-2]MDE1465814.1 ATPase, T2SS/T4P/T4SS family [Spartinivicinus sp. A2-2]
MSNDNLETGIIIAQLLIKNGLIDEAQLKYVTRIREKLVEEKTLLNTMLELGYFDKDQLKTVLVKSKINVPIGELLVELGDITLSELKMAMKIQNNNKEKKIGSILVERYYIKEERLIEVLSTQLDCPKIDFEIDTIDKSLIGSIQFNWYELYQFIPVFRKDNKVYVACIDPLDKEVKRIAEMALKCEVVLGISSQRLIKDVIKKLKKSDKPPISSSNNLDENIIHIVEDIFKKAIETHTSDIHIEPTNNYSRVSFRRHGVLFIYKEFDKSIHAAVITRLKVLGKADIAERRRHQDGKIEYQDASGRLFDIRCSFYISIHGEKACLRLLNRKTTFLNLDSIGMVPSVLERFKLEALSIPTGVVLITGPTNSGKTTTLYSCIDYLNNTETSIITAEDPVEYIIDGITQCALNPKIDLTFADTLRHMVRQDPDVIVLGEIRDKQSTEAAIQAALTGHKVLTTFHTADTIGGLLRLMNMNIETFLISTTVVSVLAQRLLRRVCGACAEHYKPSTLEIQQLSLHSDSLKEAGFKYGAGCEKCHYTGYDGRVSVFELLVLNERVKDAILTKQSSYDIRRISIETSGLITLLEDGIEKACNGVTTLSEVLRMLPRSDRPRPLEEIKRLCNSHYYG